VHSVCRTYHRLRNRFGRTQLNFYVMWVVWIIVVVNFEMELVSVQDRCMVCVKRVIRWEIIFGCTHDTPSDEALVEACFGLLGDCGNLGAR
jgi:hypothetical protein